MKNAIDATRRTGLNIFIALFALSALVVVPSARGVEAAIPLQIAYAGSMGSMIDGAMRPAVAAALAADLRGRAQGSTGLARMIAAGSIRPDVFIAVTPGPMRTVIAAGKTARAIPVARTEMVIAYSPHSRFATQFAHSDRSADAKPWWQILETPGLRFGRTDPNTDPLGLNIIFTMQLARVNYHQPDLTRKILGPLNNPSQIFMEPQLMARLQAGQLDASAAYKTQPGAFGLPYVALPAEINLGDAAMEPAYKKAAVSLNGKPRHPSPLIYYAAVMNDAAHPRLAARFVSWLQGPAARGIFAKYHYDPPGDAKPLAP
jgi:molybdate/tungstate transport system substrate-binding protein